MATETEPEWYGAKTVYAHDDLSERNGKPCFEERVVVFQAKDSSEAILMAEKEAKEYADGLDGTRYLDFVNVFHMFEPLGKGAEVFSIMRALEMEEEEYLRHFYDDEPFHTQ